MWSLSFRAAWVVTVSPDISCKVTFTRRFPTVEQQWRQRCKQVQGMDTAGGALTTPLPFDQDLATAFSEYLVRSSNGHDCLRGPGCTSGSSQWVDDPITCHIMALHLPGQVKPARGGRPAASPEAQQANAKPWLWPLVVRQHSRMPQHFLLLLPLVEPGDLLDYACLMHSLHDCCPGPVAHGGRLRSLSQLLQDIPAITCAFHVLQCMEPLIAHDLGTAGMATASGTVTPPGATGGAAGTPSTGATTPPLGVPPAPLSLLDTLSASMGLLGVAGARAGAASSSTMIGGGIMGLAGSAGVAGTGLGFGSSVPVVDRVGLVGLERLQSQLKAVAETSGAGPSAASAAPAGTDKGKPSAAATAAFSLRDTDVDGLHFFFATFMPFGYPLDFPSPTLIAAMRSQAVPQDLSMLLGPTGAAAIASTLQGTPEKAKASSWLSRPLAAAPAAASAAAFPAAELKQGPTTAAAWGSQPAWKPILYSGKQRVSVSIIETVRAALYDSSDVPDTVHLSGRVVCRFDLDGLPEVTLNLELPASLAQPDACVTLHPCVLASELDSFARHNPMPLGAGAGLKGLTTPAQCSPQSCVVTFAPTLGPSDLVRYQSPLMLSATSALPAKTGPGAGSSAPCCPFPVSGFFQVQMVARDTAQFLVKLRLMEGLRGATCHMDFCTLTIPVPPGQRLSSVEGQPSLGTVSHSEHVLRWQVLARGYSGTPLDVTFAGSLHLEPEEPSTRESPSPAALEVPAHDGPVAHGPHAPTNNTDGGAWRTDAVRERPMGDRCFDEWPEMAWGDALSWMRYSYAKVNFRLHGSTLSGLAVCSKDVSIVPAPPKGVPITVDHQGHAPVALHPRFTQMGHGPNILESAKPDPTSMRSQQNVLCAEYILWNTLGDAPAPP